MSRPYRSIYYNDERKWKSTSILDDVLKVGTVKALGYVASSMTFKFEENGHKYDLDKLATKLQSPDKYVIMTYGEIPKDKKLWVGDQRMMSEVLNRNIETLRKNNWPFSPSEFFNRIIHENISHKDNPDMYHIVCELFNSWCLWCEKAISKKFADGSTKYMSANPYDPDK